MLQASIIQRLKRFSMVSWHIYVVNCNMGDFVEKQGFSVKNASKMAFWVVWRLFKRSLLPVMSSTCKKLSISCRTVQISHFQA